MSRIGIALIGLFILINGALFFILYKDNLPGLPFSDNTTTTNSTTNSQTFRGVITQIIPTGTSLQIVLNTKTPEIIVIEDFGVSRFSADTGEATGFLKAEDLKAGDTVEITVNYDPDNKNYDVSDIQLK